MQKVRNEMSIREVVAIDQHEINRPAKRSIYLENYAFERFSHVFEKDNTHSTDLERTKYTKLKDVTQHKVFFAYIFCTVKGNS